MLIFRLNLHYVIRLIGYKNTKFSLINDNFTDKMCEMIHITQRNEA